MANNLYLIIKGKVITVSSRDPRAEAVGVKRGKIVAVRSTGEAEKSVGISAQVLDFCQKAILPGFIVET